MSLEDEIARLAPIVSKELLEVASRCTNSARGTPRRRSERPRRWGDEKLVIACHPEFREVVIEGFRRAGASPETLALLRRRYHVR